MWTDYKQVECILFILDCCSQRAYWKDITILVPPSWSDSDDYDSVTDETISKSDVEIRTPNPDEAAPNVPFTVQVGECGQIGMYISLTNQYLLDPSFVNQYGPYDKVNTSTECIYISILCFFFKALTHSLGHPPLGPSMDPPDSLIFHAHLHFCAH